ncbi:hypothetical protein J6590_069768, partial [Homalodisca vitripennis]
CELTLGSGNICAEDVERFNADLMAHTNTPDRIPERNGRSCCMINPYPPTNCSRGGSARLHRSGKTPPERGGVDCQILERLYHLHPPQED